MPTGGIVGSKTITATEGSMLDHLTRSHGLIGLNRFRLIADDAFAAADRRVPPTSIPPEIERTLDEMPKLGRAEMINAWPRNDGHNDAFRLAYWNARLTADFGEDWTKQFTTAHEGASTENSTREAMDLYNNEIGRRIATENPGASPERLADLVKQALDRGELVVLDRNGRVTWSDAVANGRHGITIPLTVRAAMALTAGDVSAR